MRDRLLARLALSAVLASLLLAANPLRAAADWHTFHHDNQRTGLTDANFPSPALRPLWTFSLGEHTWRYEKGMSVWSASPVVGRIDEDTVAVIIGAYDHNVYALDAANGELLWRFTTGGALNAAPAFARVMGRPVVFIGCSDRSFYAIDAIKGRKLWSYETLPWTYTVGPARPSSPLVAEVAGKQVVYVAFSNTDHKPGRTVQRGELFALDAATGQLRWRHFLTTNPISAPALVQFQDSQVLLLGSCDGNIYAVDAESGKDIWSFVTGHRVMASPAISEIDGRPVVLCGNFFGMMYCLDARTGAIVWRHKVGHMINATAAVAEVHRTPMVLAAGYDRCLHAINARTGKTMWRFPTQKYIAASPAVALIGGAPTVFFNSLDNLLFAVDIATGQKLWESETGAMLWPYETRGECVWSSPAVTSLNGQAVLLFAAYDGRLYAFSSGSGEGETEPAQESTARSSGQPTRRSFWLRFLVPALGLALVTAGFAVILLGKRAAPRDAS